MKKASFLIFLVLIITSQTFSQSFVKADGKKIVHNGQELLLRGMGLGGWLVQEGYMIQTSGFANAQWEIRKKIEEVLTVAQTDEYYEAYRQNGVTEKDVAAFKRWGFNSLRLPMHYNLLTSDTELGVFYEPGFKIIDDLIEWCRNNDMYLILDLHAAPGGQSDGPICDYKGFPSLWDSELYKDITVSLWGEIARRYKDETIIAGYDLLNEPAWDLGPNAVPLRDLYVRITEAVREHDKNHLIFIEGNWWATTFDGLTPAWDDNMAYSFHKYWNSNDIGAIQYLLSMREQTNVPLWMGESGENSNSWFYDCINLLEENDIGWAWWPHKKIESISCPLSVKKDNGYNELLKYWNGERSKPNNEFSYNAMMQQAENFKYENTQYKHDVIDAMIRQQTESETIPFANNTLPGKIFFTDYDYGRRGEAYNDKTYENIGGSDWNSGWTYRNDGVDIEGCSDNITNGYNVGFTETGEWMRYTCRFDQSGIYKMNIRYSAGADGGNLMVKLNGELVTNLIPMKHTGGWQNWETITIDSVWVPAGLKDLQVQVFFGGFNLNYIEFQTITTDVEDDAAEIVKYELNQNYPNPFNPTTTINFVLAKSADTNLSLYDVMGREVEVLINENLSKGSHSYNLNASNLASGIYLIRLKTGSFRDIIKITLLK